MGGRSRRDTNGESVRLGAGGRSQIFRRLRTDNKLGTWSNEKLRQRGENCFCGQKGGDTSWFGATASSALGCGFIWRVFGKKPHPEETFRVCFIPDSLPAPLGLTYRLSWLSLIQAHGGAKTARYLCQKFQASRVPLSMNLAGSHRPLPFHTSPIPAAQVLPEQTVQLAWRPAWVS